MKKMQNKKTLVRFGAWLAVAVFLIVSCKGKIFGPKESDNKSVQSLEAGSKVDLSNRVCATDLSKASIHDDPETALINAYNAAPKNLRTFFIDPSKSGLHLDGANDGIKASFRLEEGSIVEEKCRTNFHNIEKTEQFPGQAIALNACWLVEDGKPYILMSKMTNVIYNNTIPMMVYLFYELYLDRGYNEAKKTISPNAQLTESEQAIVKYMETLRTQRADLARAWLVDMNSLPNVLADVTTKLGVKKNQQGLYDVESSKYFLNFVLAEAVDAYYCSKDSRADFDNSTLVVKTRETFKKLLVPHYDQQ